MGLLRRSGDQVLLLLLSVVGAGIAIYLTTVHYAHVPLVCSTTGFIDCARVVSSPYSLVPGTTIPITIPGLAWCVVSAALAIAGLRLLPEHYWVRVAEFIWFLLGIFTALYLVYVELVLLHSLCAWCTALHVIILIMFLVALVRLPRPESEAELEFAEEEAPRATKTTRNART